MAGAGPAATHGEDHASPALVSCIAVSALGAVSLAVSIGASLRGQARPASLVAVGAVAFVVLLPFTFLGAYAARRWLGVPATPLLEAILEPPARPLRLARLPLVVAGAALASAAVSVPLALLLAPEVGDEAGLPFAGLGFDDMLVANTLVFVEEIVFRLALLFPLAALFGARRIDRDARWPPGAGWAAIIVSAILFGLVHVPNAFVMEADVMQYAIFSFVQKGLAVGTIFGYVAWRWGLEAAMAAHYATNVLFVLPVYLAA